MVDRERQGAQGGGKSFEIKKLLRSHALAYYPLSSPPQHGESSDARLIKNERLDFLYAPKLFSVVLCLIHLKKSRFFYGHTYQLHTLVYIVSS